MPDDLVERSNAILVEGAAGRGEWTLIDALFPLQTDQQDRCRAALSDRL